MLYLTDSQLRALQNLAAKREGNVTPFLGIADAQYLTSLGLAERSRQGWRITAAGAAHLAGLDPVAERGASVTELHVHSDAPARGDGPHAPLDDD